MLKIVIKMAARQAWAAYTRRPCVMAADAAITLLLTGLAAWLWWRL